MRLLVPASALLAARAFAYPYSLPGPGHAC